MLYGTLASVPEDAPYVPQLPEHPVLREIALMVDEMGMWGEVLDDRFRSVFVSRELLLALGLNGDQARSLLGRSLIARTLDERYADIVRPTEESSNAWARHNVPIMRRYLQPGDPDFNEVFGAVAPNAA